MGFIERMYSGEFVKLCEIDPPKGVDISKLISTAKLLKGRIDALIVSDMPSAVMTMGSLSASFLLKENGFDAVYSILCRDRNVLALQSDLLSAGALGLKNVYITEGDNISYGDHPKAKAVNEINASELLSLIKKMQNGYDYAGNVIDSPPRFNTGSFINANASADLLNQEIHLLGQKIEHGGSFFLTPPIFNLQQFEEFIKNVRKIYKTPIIAGVLLLKSVATARYLNKHVDGVTVSDRIIDRLYSAGDKLKESIAITAEIIRELKNLCEGVKIMAMGWEDKIPAFIDAVEG